MRALIVFSVVLGAATAFAQGSAAGSAAPADSAGSAAPAASAPVADPAPAIDLPARRTICEGALKAPPGGDTRFISEVQAFARGLVAQPQLEKTPEGLACIDAVNGIDDFRSASSTVADTEAAKRLADEVELQHEHAAKAIAKNQKHVVLAYAALWLLAAGFLLFLWRRQQALKTEIANLKRDLDAATKT